MKRVQEWEVPGIRELGERILGHADRGLGEDSHENYRALAERVLFRELGITAEDIVRYYLPLRNSGYLSAAQKFFLLLSFDGDSLWKRLLQKEGNEEITRLSGSEVEGWYAEERKEEWRELSEQRIKMFFLEQLCAERRNGMLEFFLNHCPWQAAAGSVLRKQSSGKELSGNGIGIKIGERWFLPEFLIWEEGELCRAIRHLVSECGYGELTRVQPVFQGVWCGKRKLYAVRPPCADWGVCIGAVGKEESGTKSGEHWIYRI